MVSGDLLIYSGLENGVTAVRLARKGNQWAASPVWKNEQVSMYMSSPVISKTTIYGLSTATRAVLRAGCHDGQDPVAVARA